jgi:chemotaxis protein MotB
MSRSRTAPAAPGRRSRRTHGHGTDAHDNQERWLLTYADMITLLLVLFIVLFALSKINQSKYKQFQESVSEDRVVGDSAVHGTKPQPPHGAHPTAATTSSDQLKEIEQALSKALAQRGMLGDVTLSINSSGLVEGLVADSTFFQVDSAQLSPLGQQIVDASGGVLARYGNDVDIAGYTDNQVITGGPFDNNWELSAARATSVVERLTQVDAVDPQRVVALAYGQYHPVVANTSPAAQAQNRRVNIVVKRQPAKAGTVPS